MTTIKKAQDGTRVRNTSSEGSFKKSLTGANPPAKPKKKGKLREFLTADPKPISGRVNKVYKSGGSVKPCLGCGGKGKKK
jgi:hypothetical protein